MKVQSSLFVSLAGAMAAGCIVVEHPAPAPPPPPPPVASQSTPAPVAHPVPLPAHGPQPAQPAPKPPAPPPAPWHGPVLPPLPAHGGVTPTPAPGPAGACLDNASASAAACPAGCSRCQTYASDFDPKVAAAMVACVTASGCAQVDTCAKKALAQACPDSTVAPLCQIAAAKCSSTPADCTATLSGLNSQGQDAVAACVAQGGCTGGLFACVQALAH